MSKLAEKRTKLLIKYLNLLIKENIKSTEDIFIKRLLSKQILFSKSHKIYDKKMVLGMANKPTNLIIFYIKNIRLMFDARIMNILTHEIAHLEGANEKQATKRAKKEPKYYKRKTK